MSYTTIYSNVIYYNIMIAFIHIAILKVFVNIKKIPL